LLFLIAIDWSGQKQLQFLSLVFGFWVIINRINGYRGELGAYLGVLLGSTRCAPFRCWRSRRVCTGAPLVHSADPRQYRPRRRRSPNRTDANSPTMRSHSSPLGTDNPGWIWTFVNETLKLCTFGFSAISGYSHPVQRDRRPRRWPSPPPRGERPSNGCGRVRVSAESETESFN